MSVHDDQRVNAIPVWGPENLPLDTEVGDPDGRGFAAVLHIFLRTWPFLRSMVIGYWRDRSVLHRRAWQTANNREWSYRYAPFLVTTLFLLGPVTGEITLGINWRLDVLLYATLCLASLSWLLNFANGRIFAGAAIAAVLVGTSAMLFAIFVVDGWEDDIHVGAVCFACLSMWLFQYRIEDGQLRVRLRLGCHLVYYYVMVWLSTLVGIVAGRVVEQGTHEQLMAIDSGRYREFVELQSSYSTGLS